MLVLVLLGIAASDDVDHTFAEEPQEEGMMQQSSSFPYKTKVIESSRTWRRLSKVSMATFTIIDVDLHKITNKLLCPMKQRGCQSLRFAEHKELNVQM